MKKIVLLAFVLVLLSLPVVARTSTTLNTAPLGAHEGMAGVKAGVANVGSEANPKLITTTIGYELAWSPAGDKIAFTDGYGNLMVINVDGTNEHIIAKTSVVEGINPSWFPDGNRIVFGDSYSIKMINVDGSNLTTIATGFWGPYPALSSDGTKIAYMDNAFLSGLNVVNVDGTNKHLIWSWKDPVFGDSIRGHFVYQDWSPDDGKIVVNVEEFNWTDSSGYGIGRSIWVINSDGSNATKLVPTGWYPQKPEWSPDGTKIVYSHIELEKYGIWIMNADGSNKTWLVKGGFPTWSPDGRKIAYFYSGIYILDLHKPSAIYPDTDNDGIPDFWERDKGLNPLDDSDAQQDSFDKDGLTNYEEYIYGTNIRIADTDDDGLSDGLEVHVFGTDPTKKDTDGDGISDGLEAAAAGFNADVMILPENWIKVQLFWSNYTMIVLTNSSVVGVTFNSTSKQLTVNVAGADGTLGICNLTLPKALVSSSSDIKIYLDNQPLDFSLSEDSLYYHVSVKYTHSIHVLMASFLDTTPPIIYIVSPENKTYTVNNVSLTFTLSEPTSWIGYSLDDQANVTITGNTTLTGLSDGSHSLIVYATDKYGNTGASETIHFSIETFPITWIAAATAIIAVVGAALLVYFAKVKKTTGKAE